MNRKITLRYITASELPSQFANSQHTIHQSSSFGKICDQVYLYYYSKLNYKTDEIKKSCLEKYGVELNNTIFIGTRSRYKKYKILQIAIKALINSIKWNENDLIHSRNYLAILFLYLINKKNLSYEIHDLEQGAKKLIQRFILKRKEIKIFLISKAMIKSIDDQFKINLSRRNNVFVAHDAAPSDIRYIPIANRRLELRRYIKKDVSNFKLVCGYFGSLEKGRGIEIINSLSKISEDNMFIIFGNRIANKHIDKKNLLFNNYVTNNIARKLMPAFDVLLMPYQKKVMIGVKKHDTSKWMSPLKMFEYLASGVPVISSRLPVLEEILEHKKNCFLASPSNVNEWYNLLKEINENINKANKISTYARQQILNSHTWDKRASFIINKIN